MIVSPISIYMIYNFFVLWIWNKCFCNKTMYKLRLVTILSPYTDSNIPLFNTTFQKLSLAGTP